MAYVPIPYDGEDPDDVLTAALERIAEQLPGWTPNEAHVEYALLSEMVRLAIDTRLLAADVADSIFRAFGEKLVGVPPLPGVPATGTVTFTMTDATPRTIPAGTQVLWPAAGDPVLFATVVDVSNDSGTTTPGVQVTAVDVGTQANGLGAGPLDLVDSVSYVASVQATTGTSGGQDAETDAEYLDRLSDSLRLLRRIPVEAEDFAVLARDVPGVHRALVLDNYNPADGTSNNERMVAVAAVDEDGVAVPGSVLTELAAYLDSNREVNFVVNTLQPTYTAVAVDFVGEAEQGADPATVLAAAVEAVEQYLSPALWAGGAERPPVWRKETVVRYLDIASVIGATSGLRHLETLTVNGGTADVTLTGAAPLPSGAGAVTGTVDAP